MSDDMKPEKIDFGGETPPEVPDGKYEAELHCKPSEKPTQVGDWMAFLEFTVQAADDPENDGAVGRQVSRVFIPKGPDNKKGYRMFFAEVKELAECAGVEAPAVDADKLKTAEGWTPFFETLNGKRFAIWVKNAKDKNGKMRANVYLKPRRG